MIAENDLARHIRYRHTITDAAWSSADNRWTITAIQADTGEERRFTAGFLWMCQGYYRHASGYTPTWPGMDRFRGRIAHPQTWPDDLDYRDKEVVVIGSGATAATLIPAIARDCRHVTMLQRSPTYYIPGRNRDDLVETLRELDIPGEWIHEIARRKILRDQATFTRRAREESDTVRQELLGGVRALLGEDYDLDTHFTPGYRPWRQRVAFVPEGDLFRAIREGRASVATGEIAHFTETGIMLSSGRELPADIVVTATGFDLSVLGDINFAIDGRPLDFAETITYRGMLFTGVPNLLWVFGYFRSAWTLRADLLADFVCRLLAHMERRGARRVEVRLRPEDEGMALLPWFDLDDFNPGYAQRSVHLLPRSGAKPEWQHSQDFWRDKDEFPVIDLDGPEFAYG